MPMLTSNQAEAVKLLAGGWTVDEIAARLGISARAVNERLLRAQRRTGATTRAQLAARLRFAAMSDDYLRNMHRTLRESQRAARRIVEDSKNDPTAGTDTRQEQFLATCGPLIASAAAEISRRGLFTKRMREDSPDAC